MLIISVIFLVSVIFVAAFANDAAPSADGLENDICQLVTTRIDTSAARKVYENTYEDDEIILTMKAYDVGGGYFDVSLDLVWKVTPPDRTLDVMNILFAIPSNILSESRYGWISYDCSYSSFFKVYEFNEARILDESAFIDVNDGYNSNSGVIFRLPEDSVSVSSAYQVKYSNFKAHYEYRAQLVKCSVLTNFNIHSFYNHGVTDAIKPQIELVRGNEFVVDGIKSERYEVRFPHVVKYVPDGYYD